jgi:hypothetical protein
MDSRKVVANRSTVQIRMQDGLLRSGCALLRVRRQGYSMLKKKRSPRPVVHNARKLHATVDADVCAGLFLHPSISSVGHVRSLSGLNRDLESFFKPVLADTSPIGKIMSSGEAAWGCFLYYLACVFPITALLSISCIDCTPSRTIEMMIRWNL